MAINAQGIDNIRINDRFAYAFSGGNVIITDHGEVVLHGSFETAKALVAAANDIEHLRDTLGHKPATLASPTSGPIETIGGEYTIDCRPDGTVSIDRSRRTWVRLTHGAIAEVWWAAASTLAALREAEAAS